MTGSLLQTINDQRIEDTNKDAYSTNVGYFGSLKILGGAFNGIQEEGVDSSRKFASQRDETPVTDSIVPAELNSTVSATKLDDILNDLSKPYGHPRHQEILLATNMISVGVDIPRLGLMTVNGQPKSMTEYIQATSRVGRLNPGLVLTLYNSARVRDKSYYETFNTWHSSLYRSVEACSLQPFSLELTEGDIA